MSIDDTKEELFQYGRWASVKENKAMWYHPMGYYPANDKRDPICISHDRALFIDKVLSGIKSQDEQGYEALTSYLIQRKTHHEIGRQLKCTRQKAAIMVTNTIYMVHGILIAQNVVLDA